MSPGQATKHFLSLLRVTGSAKRSVVLSMSVTNYLVYSIP
jgi:hypothetical protein